MRNFGTAFAIIMQNALIPCYARCDINPYGFAIYADAYDILLTQYDIFCCAKCLGATP